MTPRLAVGDRVRVRRGVLAGQECVIEHLSGFAVFVRTSGGRVHVVLYPDLERVAETTASADFAPAIASRRAL